jgi:hypothetical protein
MRVEYIMNWGFFSGRDGDGTFSVLNSRVVPAKVRVWWKHEESPTRNTAQAQGMVPAYLRDCDSYMLATVGEAVIGCVVVNPPSPSKLL